MTRKEIKEWASKIWLSITHKKEYAPLIELEGKIVQKGRYGSTIEICIEGKEGNKRALRYTMPLNSGVSIGDTIRVKFDMLIID